jgi:hypothetical protein
MRQTLHKLFSYAIKHHGFHCRYRRYPNPVKGVDRRRESAPQIRFLRPEEIKVQLQVVAGSPGQPPIMYLIWQWRKLKTAYNLFEYLPFLFMPVLWAMDWPRTAPIAVDIYLTSGLSMR